jgi:DNA-binding XRE family transcriptional regulator
MARICSVPYGARVAMMRRVHRLTQENLAEIVGVSKRTLYLIEAGIEPDSEIDQAIRTALGLTDEVDGLFDQLQGIQRRLALAAAEPAKDCCLAL